MKTKLLGTSVLAVSLTCFSIIAEAQPPTITGMVTVCKGVEYSYGFANGFSTCNYVSWSADGGGTATTYQNGASASVLWTSTGTFNVHAWIAGGGVNPGCTDQTFDVTLQVTVKDKPGVPSLSRDNSYSELCGSDSWTVTATTSGYSSTYGYDWYATGGVLINGSGGYTENSPLHTSSSSVTVTAGSGFGICMIKARLNNTTDCSSNWSNAFTTQVGVYNNDQFSIGGPSSACSNQSLSFNPSMSGSPITGYQWHAPSGWSQTSSSSVSFDTTTPSSFSGGVVTLQLQNRCGWTGSPATKFVSSASCFGFRRTVVASPNPASKSVELTQITEGGEAMAVEDGTTLEVFDKTGVRMKSHVTKPRSSSLDVSDLPNGIYYLRIRTPEQVVTRQLVVQH